LTLALCAEMTRSKRECDYYSEPGETALPALNLVGEDAEKYLQDHEFHRQQVGFAAAGPMIDATPQPPTVVDGRADRRTHLEHVGRPAEAVERA
jgi:hypothetical protein